MALTPQGRIKAVVTGARGFSFADIARQSGSFGVVPTETDSQVNQKFANYAIQQNPGFQGPEGPAGTSPYVDIRALGGSPDANGTSNGAENSAALQEAIDDGAKRIVKPSSLSGNSVYRFDSPWPISQMSGFVVDVGPDVTLSHAADSDLINDKIVYTGPTKHFLRSLGVEYVSYPESTTPKDQKRIFIEPSGPDKTTWKPVACNDPNQIKPRVVAWNTSDDWTSSTFSDVGSSAFQLLLDGSFRFGMHRMIPGKRIFARPTLIQGTPLLAAVVRHTGGFEGVTTTTNQSGLGRLTKYPGTPGDISPINSFIADTHASYQGRYSEWSIAVENWNQYAIYFNGYAVARYKTSGVIFEVGFGGYASAAGDRVEWQDVVIADGAEGTGELISVACFGDSKTAPRDGAWPLYARQALDLTQGVRCYRFDNYAVGGQGSSQQLSAMQSANLAQYNDVHVNIGTNDVQGGLAVADFLNNISQMADAIRNAGAVPTFSIFDLWYTQGQAGPRGQATVNYQMSAPYRSAIRRYCADQGIGLIDETMLSGPIIGNYVNTSLSPNLKGQGDPWQFDNIHETSLANRIRGTAIARLILSNHSNYRGYNLLSQALPTANGWAGTPNINITFGGDIFVSGSVSFASGASRSDGTVIAVMPPYVRQSGEGQFPARGDNGESGWVVVNYVSGEISIRGFSAANTVSLSNINFPLGE